MTAKQSVFRLTLPSNPKHIGKVEGLLMKIKRAVRLDDIQMHKLMVSLTEAVNNAIIHGNKSDATKKVTVRCEVRPEWLVCVIADQGKGFKVDNVRNPLNKENLLRDSGRGIFLMKTLMDKVEYDVKGKGVEVVLWLDLTKHA
ncbi:MAG: ATP-binding protein [Bacteroidota bacterium]